MMAAMRGESVEVRVDLEKLPTETPSLGVSVSAREALSHARGYTRLISHKTGAPHLMMTELISRDVLDVTSFGDSERSYVYHDHFRARCSCGAQWKLRDAGDRKALDWALEQLDLTP